MTDDDLRAILVQCRRHSDGHMAIQPDALAEIVADALRFRWLMKEMGFHYTIGDDWYSSGIQWGAQTRREAMRDAIDAAMTP